uniref:Sensory/regulatory protein RpfC n=1 Tax=uncultured bacterium contig00048 TaxID=1181533 RepID=A0A806KLB3_9BACT|nr:PAS/PAC sensor hybrid histidine kinase [uncultured bacterium contig00048]
MGIIFINDNYELIDCNLEAMAMFNAMDKEQFLAHFHDNSPEYQPNGMLSSEKRKLHLREAAEKGSAVFEWEHKTKSGEPLPCIVTAVRSTYKHQNVQIAHIQDMRGIREAEKLTRLVLDTMPLCAALWNRDMKNFLTNKETQNLLGLKSIEDFVVNFNDYLPEYQPDGRLSAHAVQSFFMDAMTNGYVRGPLTHRSASGELISCEVTAVRIEYNDSFLVATYTRDLRETEAYLKEMSIAHDNLRLALAAAESANQAKTIFLANMSHEIRTPLNSIIGFSELALDDDITPKTGNYLSKILSNGEWLLQIVNDILDISKIEAGKMELERVPFDLHDIFTHCHAAIVPKAQAKGIELYCYAEPALGKKLLGDPVRLRQTLINILSNAVKFTNIGTAKLLASIVASDDKTATIYFEVKDSGIGMTKDQIARIFDPFIQADGSITRKYGGTGLGLSITKNFIEMMGGQLRVESEPGIGSKFSFEIKFDTINDVSETENPKDELVAEIEKPHFEGEILVCEDNEMNQQVICEHLKRVGLTPVVAVNGQEGVDAVVQRLKSGEKPFDLIFMDIHMPVMDGLEASVEIVEMGCRTPIVAMTANIMANDLELYRRNGIADHLGKPFTTQELWRCLLKYIKPV